MMDEIQEEKSDCACRFPRDVQRAARRGLRRLNELIGFRYWKTYSAACFWSNISTPVSLLITVITALTTGEAATQNLLPTAWFQGLSVCVLIVSTLNTFFRPHVQMTESLEALSEWNKFGLRFQDLHFQDPLTLEAKKAHLLKIRALQQDVNQFEQAAPQRNAFLTDFIHYLARKTCLRGKESWIIEEEDEEIEEGAAQELDEKKKKIP